ncbi:unnamed protein product [Mycena citricolor]|uniref:Uncharacterized protein n=1 Tax=Mycena citricolor TaxID=2018698 RepID=A0AAD2HU86_9AGAR|nr:unnamed protein product [Mycena citricolor]
MSASLQSLEIPGIRFDHAHLPVDLSFPHLRHLLLSICGFNGVTRPNGIDREAERRNVGQLLRSVAGHLESLEISGDLMPEDFLELEWPRLRSFTAREHTPSPYMLTHALLSKMPLLRELALLYAAEITGGPAELHPPFPYATDRDLTLSSLCPYLTSVVISNVRADDPILALLPTSLHTLRIVAERDSYRVEHPRLYPEGGQFALTNASATEALILRILSALQRFTNLYTVKISLDFLNLSCGIDTSPVARWLLDGLPHVDTVHFNWERWRSPYLGLQWVGRYSSDREYLARPPPPKHDPEPYFFPKAA